MRVRQHVSTPSDQTQGRVQAGAQEAGTAEGARETVLKGDTMKRSIQITKLCKSPTETAKNQRVVISFNSWGMNAYLHALPHDLLQLAALAGHVARAPYPEGRDIVQREIVIDEDGD